MSPKLLLFPFSLIVFVWSFVSLTKPAWSEYQSGKSELQKLISEKQSLTRGISNIQKALTEFKHLGDDDKKKVYNAIPEHIDGDNLVAEINKSASQSGVMVLKLGTNKSANRNIAKCKSVTNNSQETDVDKNDCTITATPVGVSLSAIGSYPMIKDFLSKLDIQNRVIVPHNFSLSVAKITQNNEAKQQEEEESDLVNAKINFDVFQKQSNSKIVLSKAIDNDKVLKSLLTGGISRKGLKALQNMITSDLFYPVTVDNVGKENLFKSTSQPTEAVQ